MAIMHPQNIDIYNPTKSEHIFFDALQKQLDDKFHVYYSLEWYSKDSKGNRINSECDFLIFSSELGYLTIEVKGGKRIEVDDRTWKLYYNDLEGNQVVRDLGQGPYNQAKKSMYYFFNYYKKETSTKFQGAYGMAVAFPFFNIDEELGNNAPRDLTIELADMDHLEKKIREIFHYWNKKNGGRFLSNNQTSKFVNIVNKRIALSVAAGALIPLTRKKLEVVNIVQDSTISLLSNYSRVQIVGGAGTGKTWIGIKKLRQQLLLDKKCLFTSYNPELIAYVSKIINEENFDCVTTEQLFSKYLTDDEKKALERNVNGDRLYNNILRKKKLKKYDCIIVDEAQDLCEDWANSITLFEKKNCILFVLYDENQNIYKRNFGHGFHIDDEPYLLTNNIRNTKNIHDWVISKTNFGKQIISNDICGCEPEFHECYSIGQIETYLNNIFIQLNQESICPKDIVVLGSTSNDTVYWNGRMVGEYTLTEVPKNDNDIKYASVSEFKGLEANIIVFVNSWIKGIPKDASYYQRLYIAGTRAKYYLYVLNYEYDGNA